MTYTPAEAFESRSARRSAGASAWQRAITAFGTDIGDIPAVENPSRRFDCERNFRFFCETYFAPAFPLAWSDDHLRVIGKIETAVLDGGLFAYAMPRGSGKTTLLRIASMWALLYGHRKWAFMVAGTDDKARELLRSTKKDLLNNKLLLGDFPESCYPIFKLEGEPRRCGGQKCNGAKTNIVWTDDKLVFATIPNSACSGSIISVEGLTGNIRGQVDNRPDGTVFRPDLVLPDDPQTKESAGSPKQNKDRIGILQGDILGLAGPDVSISGLMACTIIRPGDMADTITNPKKTPEWRGERTKMVYSFPSNATLWDEYRRLREDSLANGGNGESATAYYRERQAEMDEGARVAWPERHPPQMASAIEHAQVLRFRDPFVFASEFQNDPADDSGDSLGFLGSDDLYEKVNGYRRGVIPATAHHITLFVDVQQKLLYWLLVAWEDDFSGYVVDYGTWPDQRLSYFTLADARKTIFTAKPGAGLEGAIYHGLQQVADLLLKREWIKADGEPIRVSRCLVDANWGQSTEVVDKFCRESHFSGILTPSHGKFIGASSNPLNDTAPKKGERLGLNWRLPTIKSGRRCRHVVYDTNFWKTFVQTRLAVPIGDPSALTLFGEKDANGRSKTDHRLLIDHLAAEYPVKTEGRGRTVIEWKQRAERPDNHWFDCLAGAAVAASMLGIQVREQRARVAPPRRRLQQRVDYL